MAFFGLFRHNNPSPVVLQETSSFPPNSSDASASAATSSSLYSVPFEDSARSPILTEIIQILKKWKGQNEKQLYTIEEVSCAVEESLIGRHRKKKWKCVLYALAFFFLFVFCTCSITSTLLALKWAREQRVNDLDVLVNAKDGNPLRVQEYYSHIPLHLLSVLDFDKIEKMESLVLQWGKSGDENEKKFYFKIVSAFKNGQEKNTTFYLSSGYKLVAYQDKAILYDEKGNEVGVLRLPGPKEQQKEKKEEKKEASFQTKQNELEQTKQRNNKNSSINLKGEGDVGESRRLGLKKDGGGLFGGMFAPDGGPGRYPHNVEAGLPESAFDNYCRYGCGGMAVTFPYYYRPFFGYGYPLVGTESMFPAGYGGYPAAPLLASQGASTAVTGSNGPVLNGGISGNAFAPTATRTYAGGNNMIPVTLPAP